MKSNIKVSSGECIFYFKIENRNFVQKLFAYLRTINPITRDQTAVHSARVMKGTKAWFLGNENFSGKMEIFLANTGPSCNPQELPFLCKATAKEMRQRKNISINQSFFDGEITWCAYVMMWCDGGGGVQMGVATRLFHHHAEPSQPPFRSNIDFSKNKVVPKIG